MKMRNIPFNLPEKIFYEAKERYYDNLTKHHIAIISVEIGGKSKEMALSFDYGRQADSVDLITLHPIKPYQKHSRIISGRWRKYE